MNSITAQLQEDHDKVAESLLKLENALDISDDNKLLKELSEHLQFFMDFTCKEHHVKEEKLLLGWLSDQHPDSDKDVINRISSEHKDVAQKVTSFLSRVSNFQVDDKSSLLCDIEDFIRMYRQHTDREEKFIFLIAEKIA